MPVSISLMARNLAFDVNNFTVPAGSRVTVILNNEDPGIQHNFALYRDTGATQVIFRGKPVTGPSVTTYTFIAPETTGTYFFRCDYHPQKMNGNFIVIP